MQAATPEAQASSTAAAQPPSWLASELGKVMVAVSEELGLYTSTAWRTYWSPLNPAGLPELAAPVAVSFLRPFHM